MKTLEDIQYEQAAWSTKNFGPQDAILPLLGVVEELGELCHVVLKRRQNIRKDSAQLEHEKDAIGDIVIFLLDYCNRRGFNLMKIVRETWSQVSQRNWTEQRDDGTWTYTPPTQREEDDGQRAYRVCEGCHCRDIGTGYSSVRPEDRGDSRPGGGEV